MTAKKTTRTTGTRPQTSEQQRGDVIFTAHQVHTLAQLIWHRFAMTGGMQPGAYGGPGMPQGTNWAMPNPSAPGQGPHGAPSPVLYWYP